MGKDKGSMKTNFERKPDFDFKDFVIEKTVTVPAEVFEDMLQHPLEDRPFITENIPLMHQDEGGVYHCLLILGRGRADGILTESEGYSYPRYALYVPEAAALQYPSLSTWNRKLVSAVDVIITEGTAQTTEGNWSIGFAELEARTGLCVEGKPFLQEVLRDMLCDRPETADVAIDDSKIDVVYYLDFCPNISENLQVGTESGMKMQ